MKFLDSQRIHNLIEYLEELHDHGKATVDHTTLLLNCYAKLKNTEKLETFIKSGTNFDLETAISMCRQGGYYDQAVFLAKKNKEHELVIDILIEDSRNYVEALDYTWHLGPQMAYPNLMKYARVFLEHCAGDTTQMFIDYYTGNYRPKQDLPLRSADATQTYNSLNAVSNLTSFIPLPYRQATVNPSSTTLGEQAPSSTEDNTTGDGTAQPREEYAIPKPRTAFSSFVDHPDSFIVFLEACLNRKEIDETDKIDLYTTLFEMYLDIGSSKQGDEKALWEEKAKDLIYAKDVGSIHNTI